MRFETDDIVRRIKIGVFNGYPVTIDDVDSVVVPVCFAIYIDTIYIHILTLVVGLVPAGRVAKSDTGDGDVDTLPEVDILRPSPLPGPVEQELIFKNAAVDQADQVVGRSESPSVYGPFTGNSDVLLIHGKNHGGPLDFGVNHIIQRIGGSQYGRTGFQMKGHVRFQVNASRHVIAYLKNEAAASVFTYVIDGSLYGSCVNRCSVGFCSKVGYIVIFCLEMSGKKYEHDRKIYIYLTHDCCC